MSFGKDNHFTPGKQYKYPLAFFLNRKRTKTNNLNKSPILFPGDQVFYFSFFTIILHIQFNLLVNVK